MMITRSLFKALSLFLLLVAATSPAMAATLDDLVRLLETPFQAGTAPTMRIDDYAAGFVQESKIASLDRTQRAAGRVEVSFDYHGGQAAPKVRFRWQYLEPTVQEIVSDGETLWVYVPDNNQVIRSDVAGIDRSQQNDPMAFLTGLGNLSRDFTVSMADPGEDAEGNPILELQPRLPSQMISRLTIVVDNRAVAASHGQGSAGGPPLFPIRSAIVYDPHGNSSLFEFSDLQVNRGIPEPTFAFVVPEGVQIVTPGEGDAGF